MSKLKIFLAKNWILVSILLLAGILRFYDYQNRWVLNQDQARDVTMALFALRNGKVPLIGSPSSAGPFNFGALYDWLVILVTFLFPFVSGPWIAFTLLSIFCVFLFYKIGDNLENKRLGLLMALTSALSPSLVINSSDMLNTVAVFFAVSLNFYFLSAYLKTPKIIYIFLLGFTVGLANNFHFQSLGFGSILIALLIVDYKNIKKLISQTILIGVGFVISFLPNIIFDLLNNFVWIKSVASYYLGGGANKFYYPVRWLTDVRDFWPGLWGSTITGFTQAGYILIPVYIYSIPKIIKQIKSKKYNLILLISIVIQVFLMRYYKGVRSREYLITFYSYFIVFTGYLFYHLKKHKAIFIFLLTSYMATSLFSCQKIINQKSQSLEVLSIYKQIDKEKVNLFTLNGSSQINLPLFYLYYRQDRVDTQNGYKIATCRPTDEFICPPQDTIIASGKNYLVYDVNSYTADQLSSYFQFTPEIIYNWLYINYPDAKKY